MDDRATAIVEPWMGLNVDNSTVLSSQKDPLFDHLYRCGLPAVLGRAGCCLLSSSRALHLLWGVVNTGAEHFWLTTSGKQHP